MTVLCAVVNGALTFVILAVSGLKLSQPSYWIVVASLIGIIISSACIGR